MQLSLRRLAFTFSLAAISASLGLTAASAQDDAAADAATQTDAATELTIGSKAPAIDVEHWMGDGEGKMPAVTGFEAGKVYVVEFWATWCPPCVASMPHLAEMQKQYKDKGVRIVSISDEDLETVTKFLEKKVPNTEEQTYGQLTSAYSLTTDPDQSVFNDYMVAAGQNGIPTAFVVGKTGLVEWIGHPMSMDDVIEEVVADQWDRVAFAEQLAAEKADEMAIAEAGKLFQNGDVEGAVKLVGGKLRDAKSAMSALQMTSVLLNIGQRAKVDTETYTLATEKLAAMADTAEEMLQPYMFDLRARVFEQLGNFDEAIASEQEAIKRAPDDVKNRMISYLADLKAKKDAPVEDKEEESDK